MENGKYKYELHCHTAETSSCGRVNGAQIVEIYKSKGYDGVVITDHYSSLTYPGFKMLKAGNRHLDGYNAVKEAAGDDFTVLLGMEYRGFASLIDYLIYGVTEEFVKKSGNMLFKYIRRVSKLAHKNGMLVVAAHPYRMDPFHPKAKYIDGAEIVNGKESKDSNKSAAKWAKKHDIEILTTGSDFHRTTQDNFKGILTDEPIKTNDDLIRILKAGEFEVIK